VLPPNELKKKDFTRVVRGYSSVEVEEYISFLIEQYTELYRENDELERKLRTTAAKLESIKKDEESIRSALVNAQRASSTIISEANDRAEVVMKTTKNTCNKILAEFRTNIRRERDELLKLRAVTEKFKADLFDAYSTHIDYIEKINTVPEGMENVNITEEAFVRRALDDIKDGVVVSLNKPEEEEPMPETVITPPPALDPQPEEQPLTEEEPETGLAGNPDLYLSDDETPLPPEEALLPEEPIPDDFPAEENFPADEAEELPAEEEAADDFSADEPDEEFFQMLNAAANRTAPAEPIEDFLPDETDAADEVPVDDPEDDQEEDLEDTRLFQPAFTQQEQEEVPVVVEEIQQEEEPLPENPPAFTQTPVPPARKPESTSGGSVKSSILALNRMFAMEDKDEDVLGEEEFSDFNPSNMNSPQREVPEQEQPAQPQPDEEDELPAASTVESISEYHDFLRSLDEITGKNDKKNADRNTSGGFRQQEKKKSKKKSEDSEFDFL